MLIFLKLMFLSIFITGIVLLNYGEILAGVFCIFVVFMNGGWFLETKESMDTTK